MGTQRSTIAAVTNSLPVSEKGRGEGDSKKAILGRNTSKTERGPCQNPQKGGGTSRDLLTEKKREERPLLGLNPRTAGNRENQDGWGGQLGKKHQREDRTLGVQGEQAGNRVYQTNTHKPKGVSPDETG